MKMILNENILNELEGISRVVARVPYTNVFGVEPQYFDGIEAELRARMSADEFYSSKESFTIPEGYFEGLSANILHKIKGSDTDEAGMEISELSTVIARIGKANVYTVPYEYFGQLNFVPGIKTSAKVIQMNTARTRSVFRYAAAAVITGLLGLSVINIAEKSGPAKEQFANVEAPVAAMSTANNILKNGTFDQEMNSLSDKEIEQYIKESGQDVNAALVASSVNDDSKLPESDDYLLKENTLENYLKDNNLKN